MLERIRSRKGLQLALGLLFGILFGFLLQKGGVSRYEIIMGQLLLRDWTVVKVMLTAVVVGMIGVHLLRARGLAQLHPKAGAVGSTVIGGLIFGLGFGILGYCPGTMAAATAQGSLDALAGGVVGMLIGAAIYAQVYPTLTKRVLQTMEFGDVTFPELLKTRPAIVVASAVLIIVLALAAIEMAGG